MDNSTTPETIRLRKPTPADGSTVWKLVRECAPLDENSTYCNILQCDHFRDTCVLAEMDGDAVGWISGHIPPSDPDAVFVWQVAVSERARGKGLGGRMLRHLTGREECAGLARLKTTITESNAASWALFERFAARAGGRFSRRPIYLSDTHLGGASPSEHLVTIEFPETMRAAA